MTPYYQDDSVTLHHGDCLDVLRELPDSSVDSVVTDPPYDLTNRTPDVKGCVSCGRTLGGADGNPDACPRCGGELTRQRSAQGKGFMGKSWDGTGVAFDPETWRLALRVLKPGGHLLAFGGSRTWHRLACAVEDAGFEVRDSIAWLYGSGFSKGGLLGNKPGLSWCECGENPVPYNHADKPDLHSLRNDIQSPPISRSEGQDADLLAPMQRETPRSGMGEARPQGSGGMVARDGSASRGLHARGEEPCMEGRNLSRAGEGLPVDSHAGSSASEGERVRGGTPAGDGVDDRSTSDAARGSAPHQQGPSRQPAREPEAVRGSHGALDDGARRDGMGCPRCGGLAQAFRGFSTTLKPAFEPIVVARKPLNGTVAGNVLTWGTGALNIDGCRVEHDEPAGKPSDGMHGRRAGIMGETIQRHRETTAASTAGRWPANVVLDESRAAALDEMSGVQRDGVAVNRNKDAAATKPASVYGTFRNGDLPDSGYGGTGGASRFFYVAKAPKRERPVIEHADGTRTAHPTVKPVALMRWLVRLVTPPGGTVLEPFAGSGATIEAALLEGFNVIGIEREAEYLPLIEQRMARCAQVDPDDDPDLFDLLDGEPA